MAEDVEQVNVYLLRLVAVNLHRQLIGFGVESVGESVKAFLDLTKAGGCTLSIGAALPWAE